MPADKILVIQKIISQVDNQFEFWKIYNIVAESL